MGDIKATVAANVWRSKMSLYKLRTRLERLERAKTIADNDPDPARTFTIDPAVARALRDDYERACYLLRKEYGPSENGGPISAAEVEEKSRLFESIKKRARAIGCPSSYGKVQRGIDSNRLQKAWLKRLPNWGGVPLTDAEDAEEAQARARCLAFEESPERRRQRLRELERFGSRSVTEQKELDDLYQSYPDMKVDITKDPV